VNVPIFSSTVVPGKLAVRARKPVIALNNEDFPTLGLPIRAMVKVCEPAKSFMST
jgi:hypothetical protein